MYHYEAYYIPIVITVRSTKLISCAPKNDMKEDTVTVGVPNPKSTSKVPNTEEFCFFFEKKNDLYPVPGRMYCVQALGVQR